MSTLVCLQFKQILEIKLKNMSASPNTLSDPKRDWSQQQLLFYSNFCNILDKPASSPANFITDKCEVDMVWISALTVVLLGPYVALNTACPHHTISSMPFVVDYAIWRGWRQVVLYTPELETKCHWAILRLVKCLSINEVATAFNVFDEIYTQSRLGIVIFSPPIRQNYTDRLIRTVNELTKSGLNNAYYDWLIVASNEYDTKITRDILNKTNIRFDQNIVVLYPHYSGKRSTETLGLCDKKIIYREKNKRRNSKDDGRMKIKYQYNYYGGLKNEFERNYYHTTERFKNISKNVKFSSFGAIRPLLRAGIVYINNSREFEMYNSSKFSLKREFANWSMSYGVKTSTEWIHVVQYFKVRINSTLYASYLGAWFLGHSMSNIKVPYAVEERNFLGEELLVGRCNTTVAASMMDDERTAAPVLLDDVIDFLSIRLNITPVTRYYGKLGFRTYEGGWTGLLGALMDSSVDIALEPVTALTSRYQDMDFIFPIAKTMCNIYIRHQETSAIRDIFLAPFSGRLLVCVVSVALVAAITVVLINRVTVGIQKEHRLMGCSEALLWSLGILCQQGGPWTPTNAAASVVLIVCLLFAVVTYNAYAAFITSVLSVRVPSVETVADVLQSSNFKIGYIRNGADQMYLMSTKDVQLNAFYIRGYSEAENLVSSADEGLARAARQDYAFFSGQLAARSTLRLFSQARGRCALRELAVPSTRALLSFPLPIRSPYTRSIFISLLQLRGSGALARLEAALVPGMPQCAPPSGFASARAADVRTALILLLVGMFGAILIGIGEYCWKNRIHLRRLSRLSNIRFPTSY